VILVVVGYRIVYIYHNSLNCTVKVGASLPPAHYWLIELMALYFWPSLYHLSHTSSPLVLFVLQIGAYTFGLGWPGTVILLRPPSE
jgi:hypothetical protein